MGSPQIAVVQLCSSCRASAARGIWSPTSVGRSCWRFVCARKTAKGVASGGSTGAWVRRFLCGPSLLLVAAAVRSSCVVTGWCRTAVVVRCCLKRVAPCPRHQV